MERLLQTGQFLRAAVTFEEGVHSKMEAAEDSEDSLFLFSANKATKVTKSLNAFQWDLQIT